jgi:Mn2+/Fe2+ NRAMP family transporter
LRVSKSRWLLLGPGLLLAATGVGGGDMATGAFVGGLLGPAVLWAVVVGALLKFVVTEGLARWQLSTGDTFLDGVYEKLGPVPIWLFLAYVLLWSFFGGSAMMSAVGVTMHAILPVFEDAESGKIFFGMLAGAAGIVLVFIGGYRLFEHIMRVCIGIMFVTVVVTAVLVWPGNGMILQGFLAPSIPDIDGVGLTWTIALIGGVGGTITVLGYGYWLREEGLKSIDALPACRFDLGLGYVMTALFGIAMVIIGSSISVEGSGAQLLVDLAERLETELGVVGRWLFLFGAFGAVFSSLLGVWQSVPYLFAECWRLLRRQEEPVTEAMPAYRAFVVFIGIIPMFGLFLTFRETQQLYTVIGAWFFPVLALGLLVFNSNRRWIVAEHRNGVVTIALLIAVIGFFAWAGLRG